jgi:hypothetical protein
MNGETVVTILLAVLLAAELVHVSLAALATVSHQRAMRNMPKPVTAAEVIEGARELAAIAEPASSDPLAELLAHRYVVTLPDEGTFGGVMTDAKVIETKAGQLVVYTFEQCSTLPKHDGDTPEEIAGRVILESTGISYLQQVG